MLILPHRKNAKQKLIESEQKYRELADALPEIVFEIDMNGKFQFLNKTAYNKFFLDKTTDIERLEITDFIHPDDHEKLFFNLKHVLTGSNISGNDYKSILPNEETGYFQLFNSPVIKNNNIVGIRGMAH